jgi:hypothetical protein
MNILLINIYNATFIEIEACPRTLRTALVQFQYIFLNEVLKHRIP